MGLQVTPQIVKRERCAGVPGWEIDGRQYNCAGMCNAEGNGEGLVNRDDDVWHPGLAPFMPTLFFSCTMVAGHCRQWEMR